MYYQIWWNSFPGHCPRQGQVLHQYLQEVKDVQEKDNPQDVFGNICGSMQIPLKNKKIRRYISKKYIVLALISSHSSSSPGGVE